MTILQKLYTYDILTVEQTKLLHQASQCLTKSFMGVEIAGKWVQEPMVGHLDIREEDFYVFVKDYLESTIHQGYCIVARNDDNEVVGVLAGDTNVPEIIGEDVFQGSFADMNVILHVLEDVDKRFMDAYLQNKGEELKDGKLLHLFMIGVTAQENRREVIEELGKGLIEKAKAEGLEGVYAEATNNKSVRVLEKYFGMQKYIDRQGHEIVHTYKENNRLKEISTTIADGTYIVFKKL
ncbi:hypothetical protein [Halalkalibacter okhensis]|uniref:N-acetyltransferase domain-containing protein n=1 Tax=Halalkalibacter okhensis TaxID=333138 RepID=A0A0B0IEK9_9BACI|nr:hypothetical protein [Halalkalibacter okhensis]KHF38489.1 hypothetical protein LQ50_21050 [Halalkalibacter okhensis]